MTKTLLLISDNPIDAEFVGLIAAQLKLNLRQAFSIEEGVGILINEEIAATFVDAGSAVKFGQFEKRVQDDIGMFSEKAETNRLHYLSSEDLENLGYLIKSPIFGHFILRKFSDVTKAASTYSRVLSASLLDRPFGLKNLMNSSVKVQTLRLQVSTQKQEAVEAVRNYLIAAKFQVRMATAIANAVDELVMNAIFDAPVNELGQQIFSMTQRNAAFKLEGKQAVEMEVAFDGEMAAITAVDHFGSLDRTRLLSHISKVYTDESYKVKTSTTGAGIGLSTVFRSGGSFLFSCEAGERTEVTVFFRKTATYREFKDQFRFLSALFYL